MKINEITEQPVSGIKPGLQGLGGRVLNRIPGMKATAGNLTARSEHSKTARNAYNAFAKFLGNKNQSIGQATGDDLKDFVDSLGLDASGIDSGPVDKQTINSVMTDIATQIKSKKFKTGIASKSAKPKLPPEVIASVSKLSDEQKVNLARAILKKYDN
jgi:hypothetical protein